MNFWSQKRVLVTGHTGFKGSWLLLWLQSLGAHVIGYSLEPPENLNLFELIRPKNTHTFDNVYGDIRDFDSLKQCISKADPDIVIHLAAQSLVLESYNSPRETWSTNVTGTINLLESLRSISKKCACVIVTTDKVYSNREWSFGYRENDTLGGIDPYSSSKAAVEIAVSSWRDSFCGLNQHQSPHLKLCTARSGNVIGGGDWSANRIIPDIVKSITSSKTLQVRNINATRPWQHVLEPLCGYLKLAELLYSKGTGYDEAFNFGPSPTSNKTVEELLSLCNSNWSNKLNYNVVKSELHEASLLNLSIDKVYARTKWTPCWDFEVSVERTINWYKRFYQGKNPKDLCLDDILKYDDSLSKLNIFS